MEDLLCVRQTTSLFLYTHTFLTINGAIVAFHTDNTVGASPIRQSTVLQNTVVPPYI